MAQLILEPTSTAQWHALVSEAEAVAQDPPFEELVRVAATISFKNLVAPRYDQTGSLS